VLSKVVKWLTARRAGRPARAHMLWKMGPGEGKLRWGALSVRSTRRATARKDSVLFTASSAHSYAYKFVFCHIDRISEPTLRGEAFPVSSPSPGNAFEFPASGDLGQSPGQVGTSGTTRVPFHFSPNSASPARWRLASPVTASLTLFSNVAPCIAWRIEA
jgi:hypothetical protein